MGDAALHTLFGDISRLESFAAIMLGHHPLEASEDARSLARMADSLARDRDHRRDPVSDPPEAATFRAAYILARERRVSVARADAGEGRAPKRVRALKALFVLRHRQRAALVLRYVLGVGAAEVSAILGAPQKVTDSVLRAGLQAVVRRIGGSPVEARRALRAAGATIGTAAPASPRPRVAREPRAVMRLLLATPPRPEVAGRSGLLWLPRPVYVPWATAPRAARKTGPTTPAPSSRASGWDRILAAAAVVVVLISLALVPRSSSIPRTPLAVVPLAPRINTPVATHRPGPIAVVYRVRVGDTLWSIAHRVLGDAFRWPELWRANAGVRMNDGARFTDPDLIRPGWILSLPSARRGG